MSDEMSWNLHFVASDETGDFIMVSPLISTARCKPPCGALLLRRIFQRQVSYRFVSVPLLFIYAPRLRAFFGWSHSFSAARFSKIVLLSARHRNKNCFFRQWYSACCVPPFGIDSVRMWHSLHAIQYINPGVEISPCKAYFMCCYFHAACDGRIRRYGNECGCQSQRAGFDFDYIWLFTLRLYGSMMLVFGKFSIFVPSVSFLICATI